MTEFPAQPNPWFTIWTRPRATIQSIVSRDPTYLVIPLAALSGVSHTLDRASTKNLGDSFGLPALFAFSIVMGIISGIVGLYLFGFLLRVTGKWLGGQGSPVNIRAAIAWSSVPIVWALLLWVPELLVFGKDLFTTIAPSIADRPMVYLGFVSLELVAAIWGGVVLCKTLGQVQGFSAWRALGSLALAVLMFTAAILLMVVLLLIAR